MADKQNLSVQEILAECRRQDGDGASSPTPADVEAAPTEVPAESAEAVAPAASSAPAERQDPAKMSVADMLAAARGEKAGGGAAPAKPAKEAKEAAPAAASSAPAAKKDPSKMSVADMLAAARGEKVGGGAEKAKPAAKAGAKSKAAPAAKASPKAPAKPVKSGPMDTSSILAAARGSSKPGPMTKAQAAEKAKAVPKGAVKEKPKAPPMPPKPEYAKPAAAATSDVSRRSLLAICLGSMLAVGFASLTAVTGLWSLVAARFFFPNLLIEPPSRFKVGFPGDFSAGTVATKFKAQFGIWIVSAEYEGQQQIIALKTVCTHLGCTPNWLEAEQKFKCPCHGSGFYKEGINFEGPAPRPLERYAIRLADDGQIEVDKSKTYQEQLGQWGDSASFVAV